MTKQSQITKTIELENYGIKNAKVKYQLSAKELHDITIEKGQGVEASSGALAVHTGEFTGRSPQDRFIVQDDITNDKVWWGNINIPFAPDKFEKLYNKVVDYLSNKELFVSDEKTSSKFVQRIMISQYTWPPGAGPLFHILLYRKL